MLADLPRQTSQKPLKMLINTRSPQWDPTVTGDAAVAQHAGLSSFTCCVIMASIHSQSQEQLGLGAGSVVKTTLCTSGRSKCTRQYPYNQPAMALRACNSSKDRETDGASCLSINLKTVSSKFSKTLPPSHQAEGDEGRH